MKKTKAGLIMLLLFCLLLSGCTGGGKTAETEQAATPEPYTLPEGTQVLRDDVETLLIGAVGYDPVTAKTRITSVHILVKDGSGATQVLTLPKDTRVWIDYYEENEVVYGEYGSLTGTYAAAESAGLGVENFKKSVTDLLGGVVIDDYVLLNAVQLEMLAETTDGVYLDVESPIVSFEIEAGYQEMTDLLQSYATYSYLSDVGGEEYNGTDKDKLARHQGLIQAMLDAMHRKLEASENPEETAQKMLECVTTNLSAQAWLQWAAGQPETVFTEFEILPGSHYEDGSVSLWLYETNALNDWIVQTFYTQE